jgi:hypothetical protein
MLLPLLLACSHHHCSDLFHSHRQQSRGPVIVARCSLRSKKVQYKQIEVMMALKGTAKRAIHHFTSVTSPARKFGLNDSDVCLKNDILSVTLFTRSPSTPGC